MFFSLLQHGIKHTVTQQKQYCEKFSLCLQTDFFECTNGNGKWQFRIHYAGVETCICIHRDSTIKHHKRTTTMQNELN